MVIRINYLHKKSVVERINYLISHDETGMHICGLYVLNRNISNIFSRKVFEFQVELQRLGKNQFIHGKRWGCFVNKPDFC